MSLKKLIILGCCYCVQHLSIFYFTQNTIFALVRKFLSIFFLTIFLMGATTFGELLKLPTLIEHYSEHKSTNKSFSFLEFLCLHYLHGNPKDEDFEKDMKLPFKTIDHSSSIVVVQNILQPIIYTYYPTYFIDKREKHISSTTPIHSSYLNAIWQPPKFS